MSVASEFEQKQCYEVNNIVLSLYCQASSVFDVLIVAIYRSPLIRVR